MKRLYTFLIIIFVLAISTSCSNGENPVSSNGTSEELSEYLERHLNPYFEARDRMILPFIEASEKNNEKEMKRLIDSEVLPFYDNQLKNLQKIQLKTKEMEEVHGLLIKKETLMYENFSLQTKFIATSNAVQMEELSKKFEQYQIAKLEFEDRLNALKEKYNLIKE